MRDLFEIVLGEHLPERRKIGVPVVGHRRCVGEPAHPAESRDRQEDFDRNFFDDDGVRGVFDLLFNEGTDLRRNRALPLGLEGTSLNAPLGDRRLGLVRLVDPFGLVIKNDTDELGGNGYGPLLPGVVVLSTRDERTTMSSSGLLRRISKSEQAFVDFVDLADLQLRVFLHDPSYHIRIMSSIW